MPYPQYFDTDRPLFQQKAQPQNETADTLKRKKRKLVDFIFKFANEKQVNEIASILNITLN